MKAMKILAIAIVAAFVSVSSWAQAPNDKSNAAQLAAINKKLDEQNAKDRRAFSTDSQIAGTGIETWSHDW